MKIGILGLGKMGSRIAQKLYEEGHEIVVWNRTFKVSQDFIKSLRGPVSGFPPASARSRLTDYALSGALPPAPPLKENATSSENFVSPRAFKTIQELISVFPKPRVLWLMLPAGEPTQSVLDEVRKYLQKGDIVVDGGNAHFSDSEKRYQYLRDLGIEFLGIGVSGGVVAFENGYSLMVGGSKKAYQYITPILDSLAKPNGGHAFFGEGGAGHFVKMVHNGIEYGIMQSLGEGFAVLEKSQYKFNLQKVAALWQKGSLVSGFMLDRVADALTQSPKLKNMEGPISESGEARWTVKEAKKEGVQTQVIESSLNYRTKSQTDQKIQNSFTARMLNALRNVFGGHEVKG